MIVPRYSAGCHELKNNNIIKNYCVFEDMECWIKKCTFKKPMGLLVYFLHRILNNHKNIKPVRSET